MDALDLLTRIVVPIVVAAISYTLGRKSYRREQHEKALGHVVGPLHRVRRLAKDFTIMAENRERDNPVPDKSMRDAIRDLIGAWEAPDVSPHVHDQKVKRAWRAADFPALAQRWNVARVKPERVDACYEVAKDVRRETNNVLNAVAKYVSIG